MPNLAVSNLSVSLEYYSAKLKFAKVIEMPEMGFAAVQFGENANLGLSERYAPDPRGSGIVLTIYVPDQVDIDVYYRDVLAEGANVLEEIQTQSWGDRTFMVADPDGFCLMFAKRVMTSA